VAAADASGSEPAEKLVAEPSGSRARIVGRPPAAALMPSRLHRGQVARQHALHLRGRVARFDLVEEPRRVGPPPTPHQAFAERRQIFRSAFQGGHRMLRGVKITAAEGVEQAGGVGGKTHGSFDELSDIAGPSVQISNHPALVKRFAANVR
jgi:hypothetical protein